jgi:hypothetical protein
MMVPETASEIMTLCAVAKAYIASNRPRDAIKALDEIKALAAPQPVIVTNGTGI